MVKATSCFHSESSKGYGPVVLRGWYPHITRWLVHAAGHHTLGGRLPKLGLVSSSGNGTHLHHTTLPPFAASLTTPIFPQSPQSTTTYKVKRLKSSYVTSMRYARSPFLLPHLTPQSGHDLHLQHLPTTHVCASRLLISNCPRWRRLQIPHGQRIDVQRDNH